MRIRVTAQFAIFLLGLLSTAACGGGGGGGGGSVPAPVPTVTATTPATPTPPSSGSTTIGVGPSASSTALPAVGGYTGSVQLPAANTASTVTIAASTVVPAGISAPQSRRAMTAANIPLLYLGFTSQASITLSGTPQLVVTLPSGTDLTQKFYLAAYLGNTGWVTFAGPGVVSGNTVTFAEESGSIVLSGGVALQLVMYAGQPLSNVLAASPSSVQLLSATDSQIITMSDVALPGTFSVTNSFSIVNSTCAGVATISAATATTFNVAAVAAGTCAFSVADDFGNVTPVSVSVTTTTVVSQ